MVLTISTLELSVVAAAVTSVTVVALGISAAPAVLEAQNSSNVEDTEEELILDTPETV